MGENGEVETEREDREHTDQTGWEVEVREGPCRTRFTDAHLGAGTAKGGVTALGHHKPDVQRRSQAKVAFCFSKEKKLEPLTVGGMGTLYCLS